MKWIALFFYIVAGILFAFMVMHTLLLKYTEKQDYRTEKRTWGKCDLEEDVRIRAADQFR